MLKFRVLALVTLLLITMNIAGATVQYNPSLNIISIGNTTEINNMTSLYSSLVDSYGEQYVQENIVKQVSPKVWWVNGKISVPNSGNFWINNTDAQEIRICNGYRDWSFEGYITLNNVTIYSWNRDADELNNFGDGSISVFYNEAHDVEFHGFKSIYFGYYYGEQIKDLSFSNLALAHTTYGLSFQNAENISVNNVIIRDGSPTFGNGITNSMVNNSTLSNIFVYNVSDHTNPASGAYGIQLSGSNNIIHDAYIDGTAWSGTNFGGIDWMGSTNLTVYNVTVNNSGHNGFEVEMSQSSFKNITVANSDKHNFFQVGRIETGKMVGSNTYENLDSHNPSSYGILFGEGSFDSMLKNSLFEGNGVYIFDSKNITSINVTQVGQKNVGGIGYYSTIVSSTFDYCENNAIVDSSFCNNSDKDFWIHYGQNTIMINGNYSTLRLTNDAFTNYYYFDLLLENTNFLAENAYLNIEPDTSSISAVNGLGINSSLFSIDGSQQTALPNNDRSNSPAIAEYYENSDGTFERFSHTATITTTDNRVVTLSGITPDPSWYREDPNIPTYTITAIIPDESNGPHITGFAPSETNPFTPEESKIFRVWTDETLTDMKWYVDGSLVSQGSMDYTWTIVEGTHSIEFLGSNSNGSVYKIWTVGGESAPESSNDAPTLTTIGSKSTTATEPLTFTLTATDPEDDPLTFSATNLPEGATLDPSTGEFSWAPSIGQEGTYYVTFRVNDGSLMDSETVAITVNELNVAPVIDSFNPEDSQFFEETNTITINVSAHDDNEDELSYTISIDNVVRSTSSEYNWKTDYKSAGIHTINVTVSDGVNTVSESHQINIIDVHPRWDVDKDGTVDDEDIAAISEKFGTKTNKPHPRWDINQDGVINIQDLTLAGSNYGETVEG
ncbi:hypothetical protein J2755_000393 [Methanohalophilus levihalophilus]|uniref:putative Ig domain-containing protein n=1 Tax=Methanohalophilus levihalophilus TaxID=1431282 RepID=UPI001AE351B2|nr:putative Ig domain-containing protein [Methanohalophilus levihalophilus]MBP2029473.1 hypothetical protein [Methanohalophilus levihalophilus]